MVMLNWSRDLRAVKRSWRGWGISEKNEYPRIQPQYDLRHTGEAQSDSGLISADIKLTSGPLDRFASTVVAEFHYHHGSGLC